MRTPAKRKSQRGQVSTSASLPAPVGGWNARDAAELMKPTDAFSIVNWWPEASYLTVRGGSADHVTGITGQVESLMVYRPESGTEKFFACANSSFYEVGTAGSVGDAVQTGLTTTLWQSLNMSTAGGNFLVSVNGRDDMRQFDGAAWKTINSSSTPAITGVATSAISQLCIFKERILMLEANSLRVWFLPVKSIAGAAQLIDLRSVFRRGGHLVAMANWSLDAGDGPDDYMLFATDQGEVAVYKGTDPSNADAWGIVGLYSMASPIGQPLKYGGDVLMMTAEGLLPASKSLVDGQTDPGIALTAKIQSAWVTAARQYAGNKGWDMIHYPPAAMLLVNIPIALGRQEQYCMNTQTGAWTRFSGMPANCWAIFQGGLYYGGNGTVTRAWVGRADRGNPIQADAISAFSAFNSPAQWKEWRMAKPALAVTAVPDQIRVGLCTDFRITTPEGEVFVRGGTAGKWGTAVWGESVWGGAPEAQGGWRSVYGGGYYCAMALRVRTKTAQVTWSGQSYLFEKGGCL